MVTVIDTSIKEVKILEPKIHMDKQGFCMDTWSQKDFEDAVTHKRTLFVQDNYSQSVKGTLRGIHYQREHNQGKLVRVVRGEVFDVAVDVRENSATLGRWVGVYLSASNKRQLWVPEGFAHGFYVTSDVAEFEFKCTDIYHPSSNVTIDWEDKFLNIDWPITGDLILSPNDAEGKSFEFCIKSDLLIRA